jgi:hypothetical protein
MRPCCAVRDTAHIQLTKVSCNRACHTRCNTKRPMLAHVVNLLTLHVGWHRDKSDSSRNLISHRPRCCYRPYLPTVFWAGHHLNRSTTAEQPPLPAGGLCCRPWKPCNTSLLHAWLDSIASPSDRIPLSPCSCVACNVSPTTHFSSGTWLPKLAASSFK